ncbi:MAG: hypothetical protein IKL20_00815 [Alistipes sp.]|nr:hypothetical protein [Alistipes sp.]
MKKIFTKLMLLAVAAAALVSCENKFEEQTPVVELTQTVTLSAEKPTQVRTELIEGVPYWSKGDQIGVYVQDGETYKNYAFKNDSEEASLTTSFTGTTAVANTLFVYYPYTNFTTPVTEDGVKVEILANQEPTAASFDGRTDLMIAKPVTLDAEGNQLSDLEFARVAAIVKIVLKDKTGNLADQHVSSLTMTAETNLVGRVYLDVVNQKINSEKGLYYGGAPSVTATYTEATQYEVNGTNATYLVVYPQTLATGSKLSFEAVTEGYAISKEITLPSDIELLAGKVTTLNVSLAAENVVKEEAGLALPFKDDFARVAYDAGEGGIDLSVLGENYSAMDKVYKAKVGNGGILKLGTSTAEGYFTTTALDLSKPFTVFVEAQRYGTSTSDKLQITVGSQVLTSTNLTADSKYYVFEFEAASKKEQVEIRTIKRAYINDLQIVEGHGLDVPTLPAVLTVNVESITSISHEGENVTFEYSVANPVEGTSVVITADAEWLTIADNNGSVTVTVEANEAEEARNATITVKYGDLTETIAIQQNAKPAEGGGDTEETGWVRVTSLADITSGTYVIVATASGADYYCPNSTFQSSTHPKAVKLSDKSVSVSGDKLTGTIIDDMKWTFTGTASNMVITKYNATTQLYNTGANNGVWVATPSTASYWKFTVTGSNFLATYNATGRCLGTYNTQDWRSYLDTALNNYSNTNGEIRLYKLVGEEGGEGGETPETPAPELAITTTSPIAVGAEGDVATVAYTITNPVEGKSVTASADQTWVNTFDYTVAGEVSFTVDANTGAAREATVTLAYDGAESKTIKVSQAAGNTGGDEGGEATPETKTISFTGGSGTNEDTISFTSVSPLSCVITKNGNQTSPRLDANMVRMYASGGKSNKMTITTTSSPKKKITKVVVTATSGSYATALGDGSATVDSGASVSIATSGSTVTYTITGNTETIEILTSGQARLSKVDVTYQ